MLAKRQRIEGPRDPRTYAQRRAIAIAARIKKQYPYSTYGRAYIQRGTPMSLEYFGPSYKAASDAQKQLRKELGFTGRGLYRGRGGYWGRAIGNLFGMGDIGDKLGDLGANVISNVVPGGRAAMDLVSSAPGQALGKYASSLTGQGLYRGRGAYEQPVTNNLISAPSVVPHFAPTDMHTITFSNREYLKDIYAPINSAVFSIQNLELNPGLASSFPWLSQLASNFEEYELKQLIFTYKSTVADFAAASGQVGQILMCTQYNPDAQDFISKDDMMLYEGAMSCKTSESMLHGVECDAAKITGDGQKFVRIGDLSAYEDKKQYDLGKTSIAVLNCPSTYAGQQLGELWVSYTVTLRKPKMVSGNGYTLPRSLFFGAKSYLLSANWIPQPFGISGEDYLVKATHNCLPVTALLPANATTYLPSGSGTDNINSADPNAQGANTAAVGLILEFDPAFSGTVRIRAQVDKSVAFTSTDDWVAVTWGGGTGLSANIARFKDIAKPTTSGAWTHQMTFVNCAETGDYFCMTGEWHLRIQPPVNGARNLVYLHMATANANATSLPVVEVTRMNSYLSVADNGSNDRIEMVRNASKTPFYYS